MTPRYGTFDNDGMSAGEDYAAAINAAWRATFNPEIMESAFGGQWEKLENSRAPYTDAWAEKDLGITLFAGISLNHCCVEISGAGCERLIQKNLLEKVLGAVADRVTRIDIACDIETEVKPSEFVATLSHKRMRSSGSQRSASGETEYVGSRTSERFARVYRYNPPHPRSHLLRIEHVFHKAYAKSVARAILEGGIERVAVSAGNAFGWSHETWKPAENSPMDISVVRPERNAGKTVFWLVNSVAPAFRRLCSDGTIVDGEKFLRMFFMPEE